MIQSSTQTDDDKVSFKVEELEEMLKRGEECDEAVFAEMKSNILLVAGKHYNKKITTMHRRIFSDQDLSKEMKIRLTMNHIQKIQDISLNGLLSFTPDVHIGPANPKEIKDIKVAEMHTAVWKYYEKKHKIRAKKRQWAKRFLDLGEVFVKVSWDPAKGAVVAHEQVPTDQMDPMTMQPVMEAKPISSGDLIVEEHLAFNVIRDSAADSIDDSSYLGIKKLIPTKDLIEQVGGKDSPLTKFIGEASQGTEDTYRIFDAMTGEYRDLSKQTLMIEWYFRPCAKYPTGYYVFATKKGILFQGALPENVFPLKYAGYKEVETSARCISHIRTLRPYQVEINRAASKVAEHQMTVGDDKVYMPGNGKLSQGGTYNGVRYNNYTGAPPTIVPGRSGDQFFDYIDRKIMEMYSVSPFKEYQEEKGQLDPYAMLFSSAKERLKFSIYAEKFEDFYVDFVDTALRIIKMYARPELVIKNTGTGDTVNMAEFKDAEDLCYQITIDKQSGDIESRMGKQLVLNHLIQFAGEKLSREDLGLIAKNMPYLNKEEIFSEITTDYDCIVNDILVLDRGGKVKVNKYDNHSYIIQKLIARMKKPDFKFLDPMIQQNYELLIQEHEQVEAQRLDELKRLEQEYLPMTGMMVKVDIKGPNNERIALPHDGLMKVIQIFEKQGMIFESLDQQNPAAKNDIMAHSSPAPMAPPQGPMPPGPEGPPPPFSGN